MACVPLIIIEVDITNQYLSTLGKGFDVIGRESAGAIVSFLMNGTIQRIQNEQMEKEVDRDSGEDPVLVGAAPEFEACDPKDEFRFGRICDRLEALLEKAAGPY